MEVWFEVVGDPISGPGQSDAPHEQDEEHHVGEGGREVHDLHTTRWLALIYFLSQE